MTSSPRPARIAYIILAHRAPEQLLRLVRRLASPEASFFVHVDSAADSSVFVPIRDGLASLPRAELLPRRGTSWGSFGLVTVPLDGLAVATGGAEKPDFILLLSAQDYPVRPVAEIHEWLGARRGSSFVAHFSVPTENWLNGGLDRFTRWYFRGRVLGRYVMFPHPRLPFLPTWRRRLLPGIAPFGGSAFWGLSAEAASYLVELARSSHRFMRYFRHVDHPDETFFQTALLNSPLASSVVDDDLHYIDWSAEGTHPKTLDLDDLETVLGSGELFARKFDDPAVLDVIDARVHGGPA